jgi:hypothetical protein
MLSRRQRIQVVEQARMEPEAGRPIVRCAGPWTAASLVEVERSLRTMHWPEGAVELDFTGVSAMDVAGAWLMYRTTCDLRAQSREVRVTGLTDERQRLLDLVTERIGEPKPPPRVREPGLLEDIGRACASCLSSVISPISRCASCSRPR